MEYRFTNTQSLIYATRGLLAEPGETYDWPDGAPEDGHWEPLGNEQSTPAPSNPETPAVWPAIETPTPATDPAPVTDASNPEGV